MNPQRLAELQRQRDLVREHLAWLDREIAREHNPTPQAAAPAVAVVTVQPAPASSPPPPDSLPEPDPVASAAAARRGCLLLFVGALALLALGLTAIYFLRYRDRPLFFAPTESISP